MRRSSTPKQASLSFLSENGLSNASTDSKLIRLWWKKWPKANVAIVLGKASGNNFVIDVDIKPDKGKHGDESLLKWEAQHGDFPNTVHAVTGSGGLHYWFHFDDVDQYKNKVDAINGIDIRGDGAYVVAPPSVYEDGRVYRWENNISILDDEIAEANESVIELLKLNPRKQEQPIEQSNHVSVRDIQKGNRNDTIFRYASGQRGNDVPKDIALMAAQALNNSWSDPLPEEEVTKAVNSAYKYKPNAQTIYTSKEEKIKDEDLNIPTLEDFEEQDVEWLINGYLPKGHGRNRQDICMGVSAFIDQFRRADTV